MNANGARRKVNKRSPWKRDDTRKNLEWGVLRATRRKEGPHKKGGEKFCFVRSSVGRVFPEGVKLLVIDNFRFLSHMYMDYGEESLVLIIVDTNIILEFGH